MRGAILRQLFELWRRRERSDEYFGTLVNAFLLEGGEARAVRAGQAYVDVGTLHGYREAIKLLSANEMGDATGVAQTSGKKFYAFAGPGKNGEGHR